MTMVDLNVYELGVSIFDARVPIKAEKDIPTNCEIRRGRGAGPIGLKFDHRKKRTNEAFEKMEALVKTEPDKVYVDAYFYIAVAKLIVKDYSAASSNLENLINHPANSIWKSESRKLKAMIDRNDKGSIKFYLQEQLWI